jgi:glycine betaine/proline transport system ATP-binding protein
MPVPEPLQDSPDPEPTEDSSDGERPTDSAPAIELRGVWKVFGRQAADAAARMAGGEDLELVQAATGTTAAVVDASLEVQRGEIFVIMGLSGSGKSTLVRTINRLFEPTLGQIIVEGTDITKIGPKQLRKIRSEKISMVFQHFALMPHRSVLENGAYGLQVRNVPKDERLQRAREALELVGLGQWVDSYPNELSGGMRQRVGLARALATDAPILLMDEAFSALDPLIKREMQDQLIELQEDLHRTIVFITHDLNEAMRLGDRIAVLRQGRIVQIGTSEEILTEPADEYVSKFVQDVDRSRVITAESVMVEPVARISSREGAAAALARMRELQVASLFVTGPNRTLMGAVHSDQVSRALREKHHTLTATLDERVVTVSPDTPLVELFAPCSTSPMPLAVVDGHGKLLGVVPRVSVLGALSGVEPDPALETTLPSPGAPESAVTFEEVPSDA